MIERILESKGNKEDEYDRFNRVDILVKTTQGELMPVEVQNDAEKDYFHRMVYGISKLITAYISEGEPYRTIKKAFSINIVYFELGQGKDYIYECKGEFRGVHQKDILYPTQTQKAEFRIAEIADIFPRYFILKINNFNDIAKDTLDEWIYFLKNSEVKDGFKAKGLKEVKEKMRIENMPEADRKQYERFRENRRIEKAVIATAVEAAVEATKYERAQEIALKAIAEGFNEDIIAKITGLSSEKIALLPNEMTKKTCKQYMP